MQAKLYDVIPSVEGDDTTFGFGVFIYSYRECNLLCEEARAEAVVAAGKTNAASELKEIAFETRYTLKKKSPSSREYDGQAFKEVCKKED